MEQRRLRLGDILDDYCPRERRVTNHAVVAMVEEDVKQTRCTTCDAEHAYKGGRAPRRRKKDATAVLYQEVLAGMPDADASPAAVAEPIPAPVLAAVSDLTPAIDADEDGNVEPELTAASDEPDEDASPAGESGEEPRADTGDDGPFHRRLIRATLPRPEGQKDARPIPDFTIRNTNNFRGQRAKARGGPAGNGNGHGGNGHRAGGRRFPGGQGGGRPVFGPSASVRPNRGPRKRSR